MPTYQRYFFYQCSSCRYFFLFVIFICTYLCTYSCIIYLYNTYLPIFHQCVPRYLLLLFSAKRVFCHVIITKNYINNLKLQIIPNNNNTPKIIQNNLQGKIKVFNSKSRHGRNHKSQISGLPMKIL